MDAGTPRRTGDHGDDVEGAQEVWMAFASPDVARRGEWSDHAPLTTSQIAATVSRWLGVDYVAAHPEAGKPVAWPPR